MEEGPRTGSWAPGQHTPTAARARLVPLPEPGTVLAERFVIEAVLGKGGTGVVYVARDRQVGQRVAIKLLHPDLVNEVSRERLRREVQAARHGHANVVTVYDLHDGGGPLPFLSMELVEGRSLARVLGEERRRLGIEETIAIGRQVAAALDHLHAHGLVHRDVKPSNILVTADGTAKLCDLGLVRLLERGETLTATAMTVGTPAYMAPEQGSGGELTPAADVYALGLTLYECLTGKVPHCGEGAVDTLVRRQKARPPALRRDDPACPRWLESLLSRMLEPRPADRPTAIAVARAFETRRVRRRISRRALAAAAAVVLMAAIGALGWRALATRETVRVEVAGDEVHGVDARGRQAWRLPLVGRAETVEHADIDGDGREEALIGTAPADALRELSGAMASGQQEFVIVTTTGQVVTRLDPREQVRPWWGHPFSPVFRLDGQVADLDNDDFGEVILSCTHRAFYPSEVFLYWPRSRTWEWLIDHTGNLHADQPIADARSPRLRFVGTNNKLGMLLVFAEAVVVPPWQRQSGARRVGPVLNSPQVQGSAPPAASWGLYTLLPEVRQPDGLPWTIATTQEGGVLLGSGSAALRLDQHGNPNPGPNTGVDLRSLRQAFLIGVSRLLTDRLWANAESIHDLAAQLRSEAGPLLYEAPYRVSLDLAEAFALARFGARFAARDLLSETWRAVPYEDVGYRLAQMEAISGDLASAAAVLRRLSELRKTPRGSYDAPHLLARVAIEQGDERTTLAAAAAIGTVTLLDARSPVMAAVRARAHLWWDSATATHAAASSALFAPDGDAIACLVRWRLGRLQDGDVEAMRSFIARTPDAAAEGSVALAAALLASGSPQEAVATLDGLVLTLQIESRTDFAMKQVLDLGQALRAKALVAAARPDDAHAVATELLPRLTPGLLPAILCREVIGAGWGAGGPT